MDNLNARLCGASAQGWGRRMTSALDNLIEAALKSDDPKLRALAGAAKAERNRKPGRPSVLSADDASAMFIVFDGIFSRNYTGAVYFADDEPVAVTEPSIDPTEAIARELVEYAGCSINTAREFAREQIARIVTTLESQAAARGIRLNTEFGTAKQRIAALKQHTNNS
jgi:hypothetical protein